METRTILESQVVIDDGALFADSQDRLDRPALFETNGLASCDDVQFSAEQKQRALNLTRPE